MRRSLWAILLMGVAAVVALGWASQSMMRTSTGTEEALFLQESLGAAYGGIFAPEPPLRVMRIPSSEAWPGWRWRVEATVAAGSRDPRHLDRTLDRMVQRALATPVMGKAPVGVMVVLHGAGAGDRTLHFDATGRAVDEHGRPPAPPTPPGPVPPPPPAPDPAPPEESR